MQHLFITWIVIKVNNGNAIFQLESKRVNRVVYQHNVFQVALVEDPHVFNVEVWVTSTNTTWTVIPGLNQLACGINVINDGVSVFLFGSCEYDDLEVFVSSL